VRPRSPALVNASDWILSKQVLARRLAGQERDAEPVGWVLEYRNVFIRMSTTQLCADGAAACQFRRIPNAWKPLYAAAFSWLLSMQIATWLGRVRSA